MPAARATQLLCIQLQAAAVVGVVLLAVPLAEDVLLEADGLWFELTTPPWTPAPCELVEAFLAAAMYAFRVLGPLDLHSSLTSILEFTYSGNRWE
jgi:hypothetical protein